MRRFQEHNTSASQLVSRYEEAKGSDEDQSDEVKRRVKVGEAVAG